MTSILRVVTITTLLLIANLFAADNILQVNSVEDYQTTLNVVSSSNQTVELNLDIPVLAITPDIDWNNDYQKVDLPEGDKLVSGKSGEIGHPELPVLSTMIAIPDISGVTVTTSYESIEIIEDVDIIPAQIPEPEGGWEDPAPFSIDMSVYSQDIFYPEVLAEASTPVIMRNLRMVRISVYPVHYNPVTRQLKIYRNITVDISFNGEIVNPKTNRHDYISEAFYPVYKSLIANFDEYMNTLTTEVKRGGILIITPNLGSYMWADEMQEVANWKRQKGYDVVLATTHDVDPSDGRPTSIQLKSFIQNAYNNWEVPPEYVYLIGDEDLSYGGYVMPDYPYGSHPSDHQYSRLEGSDYLPDVAVCRASVDNITELNAWIAKIFRYERNPYMGLDPQWWRRAIMVAGGNQTVTCVWTVLWTKERLEEIGFVHIDTVFERNYNDPPDYRITNPITAGVGYVNYRGWAGPSGWYDPSYSTGVLNQCQNINKPGIMTSIVCGTGDFGASTDPCFGEVWIRMGSSSAPRGGPAFFGSTDHGTHTRWNNPISYGFYHALINQEIYHFGMSAIAGKMRQFMCFPNEYSEIQKYFHTYNMLGDPELEMRLTTPISLNVTYPSSLDAGVNSIEVTVLDNYSAVIENAYVTLIMGTGENEAFFTVGKTDDAGYVILDVPTDTTGNLTLTVTGRDLNPFIGTVSIVQANETVAPESFTIDDDMSGNSSGNNDGEVNPNETIELTVELKNFGSSSTAQNVIAELISIDESVAEVSQSQVSYGNIAPGQTSSGNEPFVFIVNPQALADEDITFGIIATSDANPGGWTSFLHIPVSAGSFNVTNVTVSGNGRLDPNETADLTIQLVNNGQLDVDGLTGILQISDGYVHASSNIIDFGDIAAGGTGGNSVPISVSVDAGTFEGRSVPFILTMTSSDGAIYQTGFSLTVGVISSNDPAGPDAYGYYVYDNTDISYPECPMYIWTEIRSIGSNLYLSDDTKTMRDLPFDFVYYGEIYDRITICSNGWICMDSTQWVSFRNWPLPDQSSAHGMIAGFWDDLGPSGSTYNVYTYYDSGNNRYIIEWYHVQSRWNTYYHQTFQIILYDPAHHQTITGDGIIEFVYNDIYNGGGGFGENYCTVGWEDMSELIGFTVSYSNNMTPGCALLADNRTYRITTNTGRGGVSGTVTINNEGAPNVFVEVSTGQWTVTNDDGIYSLTEVPPGQVDITFTKGGYPPETLSDVEVIANTFTTNQDITLGESGYEYLPGDANMYNGIWPPLVIGSDVTYLVNYFRGSGVPCQLEGFWASADANGDCNIIGSDVTKLVNYFRGIGEILYCADYEPVWHTPNDLPDNAPSGWPNCDPLLNNHNVIPTGHFD